MNCMSKSKLPLKVVCWNIGSALQDLEKYLKIVTDLIGEHQPDVAFFQEFPHSPETIRRIRESGNFSHHIYYDCSASHIVGLDHNFLFAELLLPIR